MPLMPPDVMIGMNDQDQPVLIIKTKGFGDPVLTLPEARELAALLLAQCEKAERGLGANDR